MALAWSEPRLVLSGNVQAIDTAIDASGQLIVVAEVAEQAGVSVANAAIVGPGDVMVESLSGGLPGRAFAPRIDSARHAPIDAVVWRQSSEVGNAAFIAQRRGGDGWSTPSAWEQRLSVGTDAYEPDVAVVADDQIIVAYNQWLDENFRIAIATDDGDGDVANLAQPYISPKVNFSNNPRVALGADGLAMVSWYQATEQHLMAFASERPGPSADFEATGPTAYLSDQFGPVEGTWPAVAPGGTRAVVWRQEYALGAFAIYTATRAPGQPWQVPTRADAVSRGHTFIDHVRAGFDGSGQLVVTWQALAGEGRSAVWYAAALPPFGDWQVQRLSSAEGVAVRPDLMVDAASNSVAVGWIDAGATPQQALIARRQSPLLNDFLPPEPMPAGGGTNQTLIHIIRGAGTDALVASWISSEGVFTASLR